MKTTLLNSTNLVDILRVLKSQGYKVKRDEQTMIVTDVNTKQEVLKGLAHSSGKNWLVR